MSLLNVINSHFSVSLSSYLQILVQVSYSWRPHVVKAALNQMFPVKSHCVEKRARKHHLLLVTFYFFHST